VFLHPESLLEGAGPASHGESMTASKQRVAIVTGGSRGIGRAVVRRLAADGYAVAVVSASGEGDEGTLTLQADVGDEAAVERAFDRAEEAFGGVDVVVHAAGRMDLAPLAEIDAATFDELVRVNLRGTFLVAREAARRLRPGGTLLTFSSSVVGIALPSYAGYAATKGGVEAMTLILARELRGRDVTVNAIAPGPTATALFLDGKDEATIERMAAQSPLERLGTPKDIAGVVAFLAGPDGRWVNGQLLRANGGVI
jgi:3-oxoacyl-[acyl-carrier protein] reductase